MRRRILAALPLTLSFLACGGSTSEPADDGPGVFPQGSYSLVDSVADGKTSGATGALTVAKDSSYLWTMGAQRRAGYLHGPVDELVLVDTTTRGFVGVWLATATSARFTVRSLNESVTYHFRAK